MLDLILFPLKVLLILLDLLITLVTFGWVRPFIKLVTPQRMRSVPVSDDEAHRVDPRFKGNPLTTPHK